MNLLIDDEFYELIHNVDLDRETLELLFSYPDILENKVYFEEFNINYFSFLANYLIFMYESPTGSSQLQDFDFQMLQYLTIQLKNLVDFTYRMHEGKRMHLCLDKRVPKKMVECILIIIDNISPMKMENYLGFCDPVTWNKIIKIFDQVYQNELDFMAELIEITSKLYNPAYFAIDSKEKEFSFEEHIESLKKVLTTSPDTFLIAAAVDGLIDIFSNEAYDAYFVRHDLFKLLSTGMATFIEEAQKKMEESPDEDTSRLSDVKTNLPQFLAYKAKHTRF